MPRSSLNPADQLIAVATIMAGPRAVRTIKMALDTGATQTLVSFEVAAGMGLDPAQSDRRVDIMTANGVLYAPVVRVLKVSVLGCTVHNLDVVCHDLPSQSPVAGLLGLNFLRHFNVLLYFLHRRLEFNRS